MTWDTLFLLAFFFFGQESVNLNFKRSYSYSELFKSTKSNNNTKKKDPAKTILVGLIEGIISFVTKLLITISTLGWWKCINALSECYMQSWGIYFQRTSTEVGVQSNFPSPGSVGLEQHLKKKIISFPAALERQCWWKIKSQIILADNGSILYPSCWLLTGVNHRCKSNQISM